MLAAVDQAPSGADQLALSQQAVPVSADLVGLGLSKSSPSWGDRTENNAVTTTLCIEVGK